MVCIAWKMRKIPKEFLLQTEGIHNGAPEESSNRLLKGNTYKDLSTIWFVPTRGILRPRVVQSWMSMMRPMNQMVLGPLFIENEEVGTAYQKAFETVLDNPELSKWKYILTMEEDNLPPQDGLLKLYASIEKGFDCVAGLYWTKGEAGQPMIYGNPAEMPRNFIPQVPQLNTLQPCNGLGMGFNLWRIKSLKTKLKDMPKPWFKTVQENGKQFTQDLYFYNEAARHGFRVACDTTVKVGHYDHNTGIIW
jgi:hypothetical protein